MDQHEFRGKVAWTTEEDNKLRDYVNTNGAHHWDTMACNLGMGRSGNSCRLRWFNYLSPHTRRGEFNDQEILIILKLHHQLGNKWSKIAKELPAGRTDNEIKNFWNTRVIKEAKQLNCDVNSDEFLNKMTARLTHHTDSATGCSSNNYPCGGSIHDEFWSKLDPICPLDDDFSDNLTMPETGYDNGEFPLL